MCGRFAQSQTREDYLAFLAEDIERDIPYDPEPIGRYNVAPGTKVLLLSERDEHLHLKWSTKTGHRVRVFSSIDFPIRLGVTHRYIRAVLVRCNIQRYNPLWRELPR